METGVGSIRNNSVTSKEACSLHSFFFLSETKAFINMKSKVTKMVDQKPANKQSGKTAKIENINYEKTIPDCSKLYIYHS